MATIREYIKSKLERYNIELAEAELDALLIDSDLVGTDPYSAAAAKPIKLAIVKCIPELLLQPDITEGGYSRKLDKDAVIAFYSLLCKELGIKNELKPKATLVNISNRW